MPLQFPRDHASNGSTHNIVNGSIYNSTLLMGRNVFVANGNGTEQRVEKSLLRREEEFLGKAFRHLHISAGEVVQVRWTPMRNGIRSSGNILKKSEGFSVRTGEPENFVSVMSKDLTHQRVVLLAESGIGKTTFASLISRAYLEEFSEESGGGTRTPVPVSIPLGSLDPRPDEKIISSIARYVRKELPTSDAKSLTDKVFGSLLTSGCLILLLDGLEDRTEFYREKIFSLLNSDSHIKFILTSRPSRYWDTPIAGELKDVLVLEGQVPELPERIKYLQDALYNRGKYSICWDLFLESLRKKPSGVPSLALRTPARLALLRDTYIDADIDPNILFNENIFPNDKAIRSHLYDSTIESSIKVSRFQDEAPGRFPRSKRRTNPYTAHQIRKWLGFHAHTTRCQGTSEIRWWRLQGSRFFTERQARYAVYLVAAAMNFVLSFPLFLSHSESGLYLSSDVWGMILWFLILVFLARILIARNPEPQSIVFSLGSGLSKLKPNPIRVIILIVAIAGFYLVFFHQSSDAFGVRSEDSVGPPLDVFMMRVFIVTLVVMLVLELLRRNMESEKVASPDSSFREDVRSRYTAIMIPGIVFSLGVMVSGLAWISFVVNHPEFPVNEFRDPGSEVFREVFSYFLISVVGDSIVSFFVMAALLMALEAPRSASFAFRSAILFLSVRRLSPLRSLAFLKCMSDVHLLRPIGPTYRFRHSEFRDYLADWFESTYISPPGGEGSWKMETNWVSEVSSWFSYRFK